MRAERLVKPLAIVATLALVAFVSYAVVAATSHKNPTFPSVAPPSRLGHGASAPAFSSSRLGGGAPVAYRGSSTGPMVVNFFASWCQNCVAELDAFGNVARGAHGTTFLGIDSDDPSPNTAIRLLRNAGIRYPVAVDSAGAIASRYLVAALPVTFFIAPNGRIEDTLFGTATVASLRAGLATLRARSS